MRTVSWKAIHDWGQRGIADLPGLAQQLQKYVNVVLSMESGVSSDLEYHALTIAPEDMYSMFAYTRAYVGEGATMASECACVDTPSIYLNTQVAGTMDAEEAAGLLHHIIPSEDMEDQI